MPFATSLDIIQSALRVVGVIRKSETPGPDEMQDGLEALNVMIDMWSGRKLLIRATTSYSHLLRAGQAQYAIGTGQEFDTPKPLAVYSAFIRDESIYDTPLDIITVEEYDSYGDKAMTTSRPIALAYDTGSAQRETPFGTLKFDFTPDSSQAYTVFMQLQNYLSDFNFLTDAVTFEPVYGEALKYNLAVRLWREYRSPTEAIPEDIAFLARQALCVIEKLNHVIPRVGIEVPPRRSVFNVYTGEWN
jgi:hypothetical protein